MLNEEELAEVRRLEASGALVSHRLVGRFVIGTGALPIVLTFAGLLIAVAAVALGSVLVGGAVVAGVVVAWSLRPRRVRTFRIDQAGQLFLANRREPLAWSSVRELTFAIRAPFAATQRDRLYGSVAAVTITSPSGQDVFAHGAIRKTEPGPSEAILPYRISEFLRDAAQRSGLVVRRTSDTDWAASRG